MRFYARIHYCNSKSSSPVKRMKNDWFLGWEDSIPDLWDSYDEISKVIQEIIECSTDCPDEPNITSICISCC